MQILKGDHRSQLRKNGETHLRKMNQQEKTARKLKNDPHSRSPLRWGVVVLNTMTCRHHGYPGGVSCNTRSREETGGGERTEARYQGPARGQDTNNSL